MENMVDALKMAFAVFVFVIALTTAFTVFSQARATSDVVLYMSDKTNFEEYIEENKNQNGERIVGIETIIPLVSRYVDYNENYSVEIKDRNGDNLYTFDLIEDQKANRTVIQIRKNLEEKMTELVDKYKNGKFYETYREEVYRGQTSSTENEETFEMVNTDTTIRVTYQLI